MIPQRQSMIARTLFGLILMLALTKLDPTHAAAPNPALAEAQLRAINHRFVSAFAQADHEYMAALTSYEFLMIGNRGEWMTRMQHLDAMKQPSVPGGVSYDDVRVRLFGRVALVHGLFEANALTGAPIRVRYTDVYLWADDKWQLVSAQNTPLKEGVPSSLLRGVMPDITPRRGSTQTSDDATLLKQLNENYVRAFREADTAWYDAHLADDYLVINGDGSMGDRAKALENFAKPTFASMMKSFPVGDVRIRRFDDVALIHAENDYELKDGRRGISRYTDVWVKRSEGRWMCVAAHITVHRAPQ
jgi:ketosteroid isomerase-like protein